MKCIVGIVIISSFIASSLAVDCSTKADGVYEAGCKSYAQCTGGVLQIIECDKDKVFNNATGSCDLMSNVGPPCGQMRDCTGKADALYADVDGNCRSYYTCSGETFMGHNICAGSLVFNEKLQTCDWAADTDPPCGTKGQNPVTKNVIGRRRR